MLDLNEIYSEKQKTMIQKIIAFFTTKRFTSFYWRSAMMFTAEGMSIASETISGAGFSPSTTIFIGLVLGEISKAINNYVQGK